jgi:hypothetical protein
MRNASVVRKLIAIGQSIFNAYLKMRDWFQLCEHGPHDHSIKNSCFPPASFKRIAWRPSRSSGGFGPQMFGDISLIALE